MHCLGAVTGGGTSSPSGTGGQGGVLSMFRALGVLVCEGRIQGPPRGYKEGPHCAPPMQAVPNDHVCEENSYLCNRYRILVQEITERFAIGSYLCVEVVLCSDCPCGLAKSTCKHLVYPMPSLSISPWQKCASEMLLEYWCIRIVPSKSPEPMNFQGLYQAVRSRLHFSQVAAWWSRSNGAEPSYITTRIVPHNEDNLTKFRETPMEHAFPQAGNGDGNSIKVTVWALPRMEEVPVLACSLHPKTEKDEEEIARALTPTKSIPIGLVDIQNPENLVLPGLVDDRLQTPCNKSGKHDCRCEEEDTSPLSPTIRTNSERKRRRSLPCGPAESSVTSQPAPLPSLQENVSQKHNVTLSLTKGTIENNATASRSSESRNEVRACNNLNSDHLERWFKLQLRIDERESNTEKRCKRTSTEIPTTGFARSKSNVSRVGEGNYNDIAQTRNNGKETAGSSLAMTPAAKTGVGLLDNLAPAGFRSFVSSWQNGHVNSKFPSFRGREEEEEEEQQQVHFNVPVESYKPPIIKDASNRAPIDPYAQPNPFHESNPGPSTQKWTRDNSACTVHQSCSGNGANRFLATETAGGQGASGVNNAKEDSTVQSELGKTPAKDKPVDLGQLMSVPDETDKREEGGLLEWFSKVPGRVLGVTKGHTVGSRIAKTGSSKEQPSLDHRTMVNGMENGTNEIKFKNVCGLELSQREVNEVLAVLRARTPTSGRRRAAVKSVRRRSERPERDGDGDTVEKVLGSGCAAGEELIERGGPTGNRNVVHVTWTRQVRTLRSSCENCGSCNKMDDHQIMDEEQPRRRSPPSDRICCDKSVGQPAHFKLADSANNRLDERAETRANDDDAADCSQTKADVLLGAILRTSRKEDLTDEDGLSSNRARTSTSIEGSSDDDSRSSCVDKPERKNSINNDEEKSLSLNKRFSRLRQLFKKEVDKRIAMIASEDGESSPSSLEASPEPSLERCLDSFRYNNELPSLHNARINNKARQQIDFTNVTAIAEKKKQDASSVLDTKSTHQKPVRNARSTNSSDSAGLNNRRHYQRDSRRDTEPAEKREEEQDVKEKEEEEISVRNDLIAQCGPNTSSKLRNNNYKDGVAETADDEIVDKSVPSALEQEKFRRSLENAASMVFHSRTGLPLTSSPAPLRRGSCCFDYDSSLNSVSSKRNALFELNTPPSPGAVSLEETDRETETACDSEETLKRRSSSRHRPQSHALLGSFEESALNGRLEPVSTVHGFTAELGASGSFCPKHQKLPVTVFFYTLGDNDKVSTPYLAHINLEKKGYQVPRSGTIQVTLLNPLGTVVKMFVVLYDLSDMPPRSHTFLRQRTLRDKTLRYLVHLRFMSSKSGRIYLHTDIRMIICRKSDVDTASDLGSEPPKELRSYTHGPTNPKFSPRC